jgi:hypothetical protein
MYRANGFSLYQLKQAIKVMNKLLRRNHGTSATCRVNEKLHSKARKIHFNLLTYHMLQIIAENRRSRINLKDICTTLHKHGINDTINYLYRNEYTKNGGILH